jgi:hypothetical protein
MLFNFKQSVPIRIAGLKRFSDISPFTYTGIAACLYFIDNNNSNEREREPKKLTERFYNSEIIINRKHGLESCIRNMDYGDGWL